MKRRKVVVVALAALMAVMAIAAQRRGDQASRRQHHHRRRRRLHADQAPAPRRTRRSRSTAAARSRRSTANCRRSWKRSTSNSTATARSTRSAFRSAKPGQLEATTVEQARAKCGGAIVGKGSGSAIVKFPEQAPIPATSPITIFNGPKKHGNPTVLAHAYLKEPVVDDLRRPGRDRKNQQRHLRLPHPRPDPENRRRRRHPDQGPPEDRQTLDLQGQEAQLHQRPLRNRPPAGPRPVPLQRRHLPLGDLPAPLPGARLAAAGWRRPASRPAARG